MYKQTFLGILKSNSSKNTKTNCAELETKKGYTLVLDYDWNSKVRKHRRHYQTTGEPASNSQSLCNAKLH